MVRKKIFKWFLILFVIVFLFSSFTSKAAIREFEFQYVGSNTFVYGDYKIPYYKMNYFEINDEIRTMDDIVYVVPFSYNYDGVKTNDILVFSFSPFKWGINSDNPYTPSQSKTYNGKTFYFTIWANQKDATTTFPFADTPFTYNNNRNIMYNLITSPNFQGVVPPLVLPWNDSTPDFVYGLNSVNGYVENGIFYATWSALDSGANINYNPHTQTIVNKPILLDFLFTDLETGEKINLSYPLNGDVQGSFYDYEDYALRVELNRISGIPETYNLSYVTLTPYYVLRTNVLEIDKLYVGSRARVYLDYNGNSDGTIYIPPDIPDIVIPEPEPEDPGWGIFGLLSNFFSDFFGNFGSLLKDLFIPSQEDMTALLDDMQLFFSDKFGFIWYPFDQAIQIVDAFSSGSADSMFSVPACTLNLGPGIGTVTMWQQQEIDLDPIGIAEYVRFFTSAIICCAIAMLAWRKFDEVFKGASVT